MRGLGLGAQAGQQSFAVARRRQHHHHPGAGIGNGAQGITGGHAEILAPPVQQVGQRILDLHAHQRGRRGLRRATDQGEMQVMGDAVAIGHQMERAELGFDIAFVNALHRVFGGQAVGDEVGDGTHLQAMLTREHFQLRTSRHAAVGVQHFHQDTGRFQPRQHRQVTCRFGVAGAGQYPTRLRNQRENMAWLTQVSGLGIGAHGGAHGMGAVVGGNTGGDALRRFDTDGEVGMELRGVGLHHRRQAQLRATLAGQ